MADVITRLRLESNSYDAKLKRATQSLNAMTTAAEKQGNKIATANQANIALAQSLGRMQTVATSARGKMTELSQALEATTIQYNRLSAAEKKGQFGRALSASITQLQGRLSGLRAEMAAVQGSTAKAGGLGGGLMQGAGSALSMLGPQAMAFAGVAAAIGGVKKVMSDIVQINMQFEQSTANLAAVMGKSRDEISALTDQAKQLGATTQYTAVQITELQTNLARLGFTEKEILNSTSSVQALATATGADLGEAANLAGAALRGFGLDASEMERVASVLAVSTTKSALSFDKLATAIPIVAPVAKQFGFTIEDVTTLLGKLSDAGFDASSAATASRNIFLNMANSSGKLAQALGRPITSIEDLAPALRELKDRGIDLAEMLELTDKRSVAAFATFVEGADTMVDFKNSITDCAGAMHDMESEQLNTLQGSITILNSAWEGLMLTFSESNGTIKEVTDALTRLLTAYTNWRKRNQGGDTAIKSYQLYGNGLTKEAMQAAQSTVNGYKAGGTTDEQMAAIFNKEKKALEDQSAAMMEVYEQYRKIREENGLLSKEMDALAPKIKETFKLGFDPSSMGRKEWDKLMTSKIAPIYDDIAVKDYQLSLVTAPTTTTDIEGGNKGGGGAKDKKTIARLKAQYEAEEKEDIAHLDRMHMAEEEYEAEVYRIRRETLQKIADLYQDETAEKARANAALSALDIQYQGTQIRLANKANKTTARPKAEEYTGFGEFSQKAVTARMSQAKKAMDNADIGSDRYLYEADKIVDLTTFQNLLKAATEAGMTPDMSFIEDTLGQIDLGIDIPDSAWEELEEKINEKREELELDPIELDVKTGGVKEAKKEMGGLADNVQGAISVFGQLGSAMQQIEDPGAKVAGMIMEAIAGIAATFAASLKGTFTPWDWIAAAISGTATMIGTIAAIKSATKVGSYASGGIVPGNSLSGDNVPAFLNSQELVLNKAQTTNLASQLTEGRGRQELSGKVQGRDLVLAIRNYQLSIGVGAAHILQG